MNAFLALWRREVFSLLVSPFVFLLLGFWFLLNGLMFRITLDTQAVQNDLGLLPPYLFGSGLLVWLLLPAFQPLLCIRLFAEEHRVGTLEPLLTAPIRDFAVVLAKYLAACVFFLLFWGGILLLFCLLAWHDAPLDWARIFGGMLSFARGIARSVGEGDLARALAHVEVVDEYQAPLRPPHVDHLFPLPPERALRRWGADRLVAKGASGVARYTIVEAPATETALPTTGGVTGAFKTEPSERYEATVSAKLEIFDAQGFRRAFATAQARLSRGITEGATLNEREELWFKLTEDLMRTFNAEFEKNIREHVGAYLL